MISRKPLIVGVALLAALLTPGVLLAADVSVGPGESIQDAIDAAEAGDVIVLHAAVYEQHVVLGKPITLRGVGWDKTILRPVAAPAAKTDVQKIEFVDTLAQTPDPRERLTLIAQFFSETPEPTVRIDGVDGARLEAIGIQGPAPASVEQMHAVALLEISGSRVEVVDCAIVGPAMNGLNVVDDADVTITNTLVAGVWNTGIWASNAKLSVAESDIRNCYHRSIHINRADATFTRNRISGSAWHGLRYDHCSPTITGNRFFGNDRTGIYASGQTAAKLTHNHFDAGGSYSAWMANQDVLEHNTFANLEIAAAILGNSKPTLSNNRFVDCAVGIFCGAIGGQDPALVGSPTLAGNVFEQVEVPLKVKEAPADLPAEPEANTGAGATDVAELASPYPLQPGELSIIPDGETRTWTEWKKPGQ